MNFQSGYKLRLLENKNQNLIFTLLVSILIDKRDVWGFFPSLYSIGLKLLTWPELDTWNKTAFVDSPKTDIKF